MARRCFTESRPLILPMYYLYPQHDDAYRCPNQYILGSELIAAPYVSPRDPDTQLSRQAIWLPEGDWFNFFTGEHYTGGGWRTLYGTLDDIPLLAKAGGIIPTGAKVEWGGIANPAELDLTIFPGADNQFELYEDDGETQAYRDGHYGVTTFSQSWQTNRLQFTIAPVQGDLSSIPAQRVYRLIFRGIRLPDEVHVSVNSAEAKPNYTYDELAETLTVQGVTLDPKDALTITLATHSSTLLSKRDRRLETCRKLLRAFRLDADAQYRLDRDLANLLEGKSSLLSHSRDLQDAHLSALSNVIQQR
jgi:hypothetical protein